MDCTALDKETFKPLGWAGILPLPDTSTLLSGLLVGTLVAVYASDSGVIFMISPSDLRPHVTLSAMRGPNLGLFGRFEK